MKLYTSIGPNPRVVKMFLAEKNITIPSEEVNLMGGDNRKGPYLDKNPSGQTPALELDNGSILAEITAICEYIEDKTPNPPLIGTTPEEKAATRMWTRRIDLNICEPMANGFRFGEGLPLFEKRMRCLPEASAGLKACAQDKLTWLDGLMKGKKFVGGDKLTLADILLYCFVDFGAAVGQPLNPANKNIAAWYEAMNARPSAKATVFSL